MVKKLVLQHLLTESGVSNFSEIVWLKSEIAAAEAALNRKGADGPSIPPPGRLGVLLNRK
jgi:hypothetical protein